MQLLTTAAQSTNDLRQPGRISPAGIRIFIVRLLSVCLLLPLLSACVEVDQGQNGDLTSSWVRPDDPQEKIGAKEHPAVLAKYGGAYSNPNAERLIAVIVGRLVAVSDDPTRVYKITILDSPKVNAFALPGGFLYVTRGLLSLANDSSELAAVIAHEMAHVSANHAILRQERVSRDALGEEVVAEVLNGSAAGQIAIAANKIRLSQFSQEQELQADTIGIRLIGKAGYDPYAGARFLKTMDAYRSFLAGGNGFDDADNFVSSHPSTPRRVELAARHARFFGAPGIGDRGRERYLAGVDGLLFGDSTDEGFVRGRVFSHSGLGITFSVPSGFQIDNQPKAVMISGPNDVATRFDATVLPKRTELTSYLKSGWITGLVEETVRQETVNGLDAATAVARGDGWRFKVHVIRNSNQVFRFITAAPQTNTNLDAISRQVIGSFRILTSAEIARLKPLTMRVLTVKPGQGERVMIAKMKGVENPESLFRLINGLGPGEKVSVGEKVKIISDS